MSIQIVLYANKASASLTVLGMPLVEYAIKAVKDAGYDHGYTTGEGYEGKAYAGFLYRAKESLTDAARESGLAVVRADAPFDAPVAAYAETVTSIVDGLENASTPEDYARLIKRVRTETNIALMRGGVFIPDPDAVYVDPRAKIGAGSVLHPGTVIEGASVIGRDSIVGPHTVIREAVVGSACTVGPFAFLRPGANIGDHARIGDFVEIKNARIGDGTKVSHLTYVGDADVGAGVNFGCGSVTVNYDGIAKYRTVVEDGAFIGCNTNLVAPVKVGARAYTAAGSTITGDVPEDALAVARERQRNIPGWVTRRPSHG